MITPSFSPCVETAGRRRTVPSGESPGEAAAPLATRLGRDDELLGGEQQRLHGAPVLPRREGALDRAAAADASKRGAAGPLVVSGAAGRRPLRAAPSKEMMELLNISKRTYS